ncbi:MAG: NifB/NifX family molybdenum-iron cluster-binding protein [Holophagae bacterium]|jgi:predicted Fe-Mo cluster-binding NifX family protein
MIIAVPLFEGKFSPHFGGADRFAIFTVDFERKEVAGHQLAAPPEHGRGIFPAWLRQQGVEAVLAGGMGPRAAQMLSTYGIDVVTGADGDDPEMLVRAYVDGTLETSGELCHDHSFHDCGHHSGDRGGCGHHQ